MPTVTRNGGRLHHQAQAYMAALARREDAATLQMLAQWSDSYWAIRADLDAITAQITEARAAGQAFSPSWLSRQARYRTLLATTKRELAKYADVAHDQITRQQASALRAGLKDAQRLARGAVDDTHPLLAATMEDINPANVEAAQAFLAQDSVLANHLRDTLANNAPDILQNVLGQGLSRGKSQDWMVRQFTKALSTTHSRAVTILRTESLRAYRASSLATYQANSKVLGSWMWWCALDARSCMACVSMHGTKHPLEEGLDGHPRCRCTMVPETKTYAELGIPGIEENGSPVQTGVDWFKGQEAATQRAMMGPAKFDAWKAGEFDLPDLVARKADPDWGTMRHEASLKSIRANRIPDVEPPPTPDPLPEPTPGPPPTPEPTVRPVEPEPVTPPRDPKTLMDDPTPPNSQLVWQKDAELERRSLDTEFGTAETRAKAKAELAYRAHLRSKMPADLPPSKFSTRELGRFQEQLGGLDDDVLAAQLTHKDAAVKRLVRMEQDRRLLADPAKYAKAVTPDTLTARLPRTEGGPPVPEGADPLDPAYHSDMDKVNPNNRAGDRGWEVNCTNCTTTYELRRRGFDVSAAIRPGGAKARGRNLYETPRLWGLGTVEVLDSQRTLLQMEKAIMRDMPEGARGAVSVSWKGGGAHIFNWEVHQGRVVYIDSQATWWKRGYTLEELRRKTKSRVDGWWRHDHLPITDDLATFLDGFD